MCYTHSTSDTYCWQLPFFSLKLVNSKFFKAIPRATCAQTILSQTKRHKPHANPAVLAKSLNKAVRLANDVVLEKLEHHVRNVYLVNIVLVVT